MSFRNTLFPLCLLLVLLLVPEDSQAQSATFITVIDGDSLLVDVKGHSREIRLIGIDAPEWGQEYGAQAKSYAMRLCFGQPLRLEFDQGKRDRYDRVLAYVYCGDTMLNLEMIRAGFAIATPVKPNTRYARQFKQAEKQARAKGCGFWGFGGLKQTPARWRMTHRK